MARLHTTYTYDGDVEAVFGLIGDPAFRTATCEAQGAEDCDVTVTADGGVTTIVIARLQEAAVPDFVKKFVGEKARVKQTERWSSPDATGARTADVELDILGQPASLKGTASLTPNDDGSTTFTVDGIVKVAVPLIGKKLEPPIVEAIITSVDEDVRLGQERLAVS